MVKVEENCALGHPERAICQACGVQPTEVAVGDSGDLAPVGLPAALGFAITWQPKAGGTSERGGPTRGPAQGNVGPRKDRGGRGMGLVGSRHQAAGPGKGNGLLLAPAGRRIARNPNKKALFQGREYLLSRVWGFPGITQLPRWTGSAKGLGCRGECTDGGVDR